MFRPYIDAIKIRIYLLRKKNRLRPGSVVLRYYWEYDKLQPVLLKYKENNKWWYLNRNGRALYCASEMDIYRHLFYDEKKGQKIVHT